MIIRKAKISDIEDLLALDEESVKYHKKFDVEFFNSIDPTSVEKKKELLKAMKSKKNLVLAAEDNNKVVGYIQGYIIDDDNFRFGRMQDIVVTSEYRGCGIGKQLVDELLSFFKEKDCKLVQTTVYIENNSAVQFYEKSEFKPKMYIMVKEL